MPLSPSPPVAGTAVEARTRVAYWAQRRLGLANGQMLVRRSREAVLLDRHPAAGLADRLCTNCGDCSAAMGVAAAPRDLGCRRDDLLGNVVDPVFVEPELGPRDGHRRDYLTVQ